MAGFRTPHLQLRGGIFYFRVAVPDKISDKLGESDFKLSLRTRDPEQARLLCWELTHLVWSLFRVVENMSEVTAERIREIANEHLRMMVTRSNDMLRMPRTHKKKRGAADIHSQLIALGLLKHIQNIQAPRLRTH